MTSSGLRFGVLVASSELIPLDETNGHIYILLLETYKCPFCMNSKSQFWLFFQFYFAFADSEHMEKTYLNLNTTSYTGHNLN